MFQQCLRACSGKLSITWGCDEYLLAALALGAEGAIGSTYNFAAPIYTVLIEAFQSGDLRKAREAQYRSVQLISLLSQRGYLPAAKAVVEEFKKDGYDPEGYTLYEYAAIQAWAQAATATGGTDGKKIAEWLRAGNMLKTVLGDISMDAKGDIKDAVYVWYKWTAGKYAEDPSLQ